MRLSRTSNSGATNTVLPGAVVPAKRGTPVLEVITATLGRTGWNTWRAKKGQTAVAATAMVSPMIGHNTRTRTRNKSNTMPTARKDTSRVRGHHYHRPPNHYHPSHLYTNSLQQQSLHHWTLLPSPPSIGPSRVWPTRRAPCPTGASPPPTSQSSSCTDRNITPTSRRWRGTLPQACIAHSRVISITIRAVRCMAISFSDIRAMSLFWMLRMPMR
mmetsp:Transcript_30429/g.63623  ORF Transcript_30429/g.63623 Transcript_30429/m.63623 type:complete len:215 (-) Transcript_30429:722-1366(-)